ncbi:MAG: ParA family protein [Acidimicrobiales bacterium]
MSEAIRTITILNPQRASGKTTTAVALCQALGELGSRVLLIDMDHHAGATHVVAPSHISYTMDHVLTGFMCSLPEAICHTDWAFDLVPAQLRMVGFDYRQPQEPRRPHWLTRHALGEALGEQQYDWVVFDCGDRFGRMAQFALSASTFVLPVLDPDSYEIFALAAVERVVQTHRDTGGVFTTIGAAVFTRWHQNSDLDGRALAHYRSLFDGNFVWEPVVPLHSAIREMAVQHRPLIELGSDGKDLSTLFRHYAHCLDVSWLRASKRLELVEVMWTPDRAMPSGPAQLEADLPVVVRAPVDLPFC